MPKGEEEEEEEEEAGEEAFLPDEGPPRDAIGIHG